MAESMAQAVKAGYQSYQAGRMQIKSNASASSPQLDLIKNNVK
jgi:thiazole synthase ThiGH ThiG subunit